MKQSIKQSLISILGITLLFTSISGVCDSIPKPKIKPNYYYLTNAQKIEVNCLAETIYFEALNESEIGQLAVGMTTINRVNSDYFPNSICQVIKQKVRKTCQFSWYCDENKKRIFYDKNIRVESEKIVYNDILKLATYIYLNSEFLNDPSKNALFFHRNNINPRWKNVRHTASIGKHIFYTTHRVSANV